MWYTRVHSSRYVEATHSTNAWLPGPIIPCNEFELRPITLGGCTACVEDGRIHTRSARQAWRDGVCVRPSDFRACIPCVAFAGLASLNNP